MQIKPNSFAIVLVGKWNPYILNPQWIAKNLFDNSPNIQVDFSLNLDLPNRFRIQNITITPTPEKVIFTTSNTTDDGLNEMGKIAMKLCNILTHTPLGAVGINFEYEVKEDFGDLLEKIGFNKNDCFIDNGWEIKTQSTSRLLLKVGEGYSVNFTVTLTQKNVLNFKFNYHYNILNNKEQLKSLLEAKTVSDYKNNSLEILQSAYQLNLEPL